MKTLIVPRSRSREFEMSELVKEFVVILGADVRDLVVEYTIDAPDFVDFPYYVRVKA
ncbi:hypothetical protein CPT_Muldoon_208 [Serratia phage Muldoon]|uniref:DUF7428 domain-containing protein n=1 Tax=Serratia phage Muldoon TaxID=2601678 RepID=A0A5P8PHL3_9CAUD|nr:hypothetical protein HYP94_gp182 [Serratia phage Muldoon]QFR56159.1 hypothetical protein CPT_Muldoon_208 [Serratia phage Muldoon]